MHGIKGAPIRTCPMVTDLVSCLVQDKVLALGDSIILIAQLKEGCLSQPEGITATERWGKLIVCITLRDIKKSKRPWCPFISFLNNSNDPKKKLKNQNVLLVLLSDPQNEHSSSLPSGF